MDSSTRVSESLQSSVDCEKENELSDRSASGQKLKGERQAKQDKQARLL